MRKRPSSAGRTYTLRNAASVVFALTAVLPLLLFTYTLYALNKLSETQAQIGLGAALFFALIGLFIFSNLMARLGEVLRYLEEQAQAEEPAAASPSTTSTAGATSAVATPGAAPGATAAPRPVTGATPAQPGALPMGAQNPRPAPLPPPNLVVPGLGTITAARRASTAARRAAGAFDDVQKSMWQAEAQRHLGQQVLVSVKNAAEPVAGSLAQITDDGVLLEQDGQRVAVSYLRMTNIEPDTRAGAH